MKLLLDTHAFIWWDSEPSKLSPRILALPNLPAQHKDPFDRLLIAQAISEDAFLITNDPVFSKYADRVLW